MAGRNAFTIEDDKAMLLFLIKELECENSDAYNPKGYGIWKKAERQRICHHSWQSMNSRVRKIILPHLELQPITKQQLEFLQMKLSLNRSNNVSEVPKRTRVTVDEDAEDEVESSEGDSDVNDGEKNDAVKGSNSSSFTRLKTQKEDDQEKVRQKATDAPETNVENLWEAFDIAKNGGQLTNGVQFKAAVCGQIQRGTFASLEEVNEFFAKVRLIEALSYAYKIPLEEMSTLIKSCNCNLKTVEENLRRKFVSGHRL